MGLSNSLDDVSSDSIAIIIIISAVRSVCYVRYLVLCLLGLSSPSSSPSSSSSSDNSLVDGSGLAGLAVLADHLASTVGPSSGSGNGDDDGRCVICLDGFKVSEELRRLPCCHVFHRECVDWWLVGDGSGAGINWGCPVCRAAVAAEERRAEAERRIGAELVAWLAPY